MSAFTFLDTPSGVVPVSGVANFYERILAERRISVIRERLYDRFKIVQSPHRTYTHGALSIATVVKSLGHGVNYKILEKLDVTKEVVRDIVDATDVLCFSCKTTVITQCLEIARLAKELKEEIFIIFGGPHPSFLPEDVLFSDVVDVVCIGEGEETIRGLVEAINGHCSFASVAGIAFKDGKSIRKTLPRPLIQDFNTVNFVDYSLLPGDMKDYYLYIETRRGCSFNCAYCANPKIWQRNVRTLTADIAYERFKYIADKIVKRSMIHVSNPSFGFVEEDFDLCKMLQKSDLGIFFSVDLCASFVTSERIKEIYDAGCRMFSIGIESAADSVLQKNNRPKFQIVKEALRTIRSTCNAFIKGYFVIGLPGETEETAKQTKNEIMNLLKENMIDLVCEHVFVPYPGCDVFHCPDKYDYRIYSKNWMDYDSRSFPLPGESCTFSMSRAYLAYIDLISSQCEFYGIPADKYFSENFNGSNQSFSFLDHKKHLV